VKQRLRQKLANLGLIGGSVTLNDFALTTSLTGGYQSRASDGAQLKSGITEKQRDLLVAWQDPKWFISPQNTFSHLQWWAVVP
jgi:hypothetical protein